MKRKRVLALILTMILMLTFTACNEKESKHEKMLIRQSETFIEDMHDGKFDAISKKLSENMVEREGLGNHTELLNIITNAFGDYEEIYETNAVTISEGTIISSTIKFKNGAARINFLYDENMQIKDMYPSMAELYTLQTTSEFTETPIKVGKDPFILDGILTQPVGKNRVEAVVVLVHPTGPKGMNTTEGGSQPFKEIAHGLAMQGISTIRYNQRFFQYLPQIDTVPSIEEEVLEDVSYAIDFAASNKSLNGYKIYIVGHSMGGLLAPKISLENSEVDGFISLAGSPRNFFDIQCDQQIKAINDSTDKTQEEKDAEIESIKTNYEEIKSIKSGTSGVNGFAASMNAIDTPAFLEQLEIPMLFLQSTDDFAVYYDVDFVEWQRLLSNYNKAEFILYDGLNHLFCKSKGKPFPEEYAEENHVEQIVLDDMASWIKSVCIDS